MTILDDYPKVAAKIAHFRCSGRGQRDIPVTNAYGITEIVMLLPGRVAASVRTDAASTLVRYLGGDVTLVDEIAQNHLAQQEVEDDHPA